MESNLPIGFDRARIQVPTFDIEHLLAKLDDRNYPQSAEVPMANVNSTKEEPKRSRSYLQSHVALWSYENVREFLIDHIPEIRQTIYKTTVSGEDIIKMSNADMQRLLGLDEVRSGNLFVALRSVLWKPVACCKQARILLELTDPQGRDAMLDSEGYVSAIRANQRISLRVEILSKKFIFKQNSTGQAFCKLFALRGKSRRKMKFISWNGHTSYDKGSGALSAYIIKQLQLGEKLANECEIRTRQITAHKRTFRSIRRRGQISTDAGDGWLHCGALAPGASLDFSFEIDQTMLLAQSLLECNASYALCVHVENTKQGCHLAMVTPTFQLMQNSFVKSSEETLQTPTELSQSKTSYGDHIASLDSTTPENINLNIKIKHEKEMENQLPSMIDESKPNLESIQHSMSTTRITDAILTPLERASRSRASVMAQFTDPLAPPEPVRPCQVPIKTAQISEDSSCTPKQHPSASITPFHENAEKNSCGKSIESHFLGSASSKVCDTCDQSVLQSQVNGYNTLDYSHHLDKSNFVDNQSTGFDEYKSTALPGTMESKMSNSDIFRKPYTEFGDAKSNQNDCENSCTNYLLKTSQIAETNIKDVRPNASLNEASQTPYASNKGNSRKFRQSRAEKKGTKSELNGSQTKHSSSCINTSRKKIAKVLNAASQQNDEEGTIRLSLEKQNQTQAVTLQLSRALERLRDASRAINAIDNHHNTPCSHSNNEPLLQQNLKQSAANLRSQASALRHVLEPFMDSTSIELCDANKYLGQQLLKKLSTTDATLASVLSKVNEKLAM